MNDLINHFIFYILLTCFSMLFVFLERICRLWCLWHCYCKSYVRYECLPFGPKRSKGLLLYGHFMARFCAFFYSHQCGWASSSSSSSKAQWMLLLCFLIQLSKHACSFSYTDYGSWKRTYVHFPTNSIFYVLLAISWTIFLF